MRIFLFPAIVLLAAAGDALPMQIGHAWARATAGNAKNGAAYVTIVETGPADRLLGVSTPVAETAGVHETINEGGVMKMRAAGPLPLEPGMPLAMMPGGKHIMLMGLKAPLKAGDRFPLTLTFEHAPPVTVTVTVEGVGADATFKPGMADHTH